MKITINGKIKEFEKEINIAGILSQSKVEMPEAVSVQLNGKFLKKEKLLEFLCTSAGIPGCFARFQGSLPGRN